MKRINGKALREEMENVDIVQIVEGKIDMEKARPYSVITGFAPDGVIAEKCIEGEEVVLRIYLEGR